MTISMILWLASMLPRPLASQTCLATTVYLEARNQPVIGQMAVAEVALRRLTQGHWGKTLCAVVTQPHQFAPTLLPPSFEITNLSAFQKAWNVAGQSITNWHLPPSKRHLVVPHADHFATIAVSPSWERHHTGVTIGYHTFYALN